MLFCFIWLDLMVKHWVSHSFYFIPTKVNTGTPEQRCDRGAVKELREWKLVQATPLTSKTIGEIIENHSEFHGCANRCNKFVASGS